MPASDAPLLLTLMSLPTTEQMIAIVVNVGLCDVRLRCSVWLRRYVLGIENVQHGG